MARTKQTRRKNKKQSKQPAEPKLAVDEGGSTPESTSVEEVLSKAFPYPTDSLDHAESPAKAYGHVGPILELMAEKLGKSKEDLKIYDPYYCNGAVVDNLKALGFTNVYNECEDFYSVESPEFDVLLTNPPYSGEHPEKLADFTAKVGKPWLWLVPNWFYMKDFYKKLIEKPGQSGMFFVAPKKRYVYQTPRHLRASSDEAKTSPFPSFWFINGCGVCTPEDMQSAMEGSEGVLAVKDVHDLPLTYYDQYDPEYKRQRNIMKSQKRKNNYSEKAGEQASWGRKAGAQQDYKMSNKRQKRM
ncbi:hypothetical protein FOZ61_004970 [Perkinsus olseni]|uniref:Uncharacterized protein n=1 Tax=Perkinsus olseni TaxID=32597 RepID=A0A7J6LJ46_PEROL|nr:hypothetical protein FOZ61_004970 [Perkinsus olseni]